ncbi:MAG TPA: ParB N-terminal domain-containing protein, partial [Candidatus Binataceae bacterium]|nr:ParB N-terminal domain-containing protein [Candidatus Binataceae bacterium]
MSWFAVWRNHHVRTLLISFPPIRFYLIARSAPSLNIGYCVEWSPFEAGPMRQRRLKERQKVAVHTLTGLVRAIMSGFAVFPTEAKAPVELESLADRISADGGVALAAFQEPIGKHWHLFALLPAAAVRPTPFQRNLSPAHTKRLIEVIKKLGRYTEPIVAAVAPEGGYWTPNGNHRRAAAIKSGAKMLPAIVIPDANVAYQILALNTEKAHNLRDKALEAIRLYRGRMETN